MTTPISAGRSSSNSHLLSSVSGPDPQLLSKHCTTSIQQATHEPLLNLEELYGELRRAIPQTHRSCGLCDKQVQEVAERIFFYSQATSRESDSTPLFESRAVTLIPCFDFSKRKGSYQVLMKQGRGGAKKHVQLLVTLSARGHLVNRQAVFVPRSQSAETLKALAHEQEIADKIYQQGGGTMEPARTLLLGDKQVRVTTWFDGSLSDAIFLKQLTTRDRIQIATDVSGALNRMHQLGVVHNDIKPSNALIHWSKEKQCYRAILADYDVSVDLEKEENPDFDCTQKGGTPGFHAPELIYFNSRGLAEGETNSHSDTGLIPIDVSQDSWSLGVLLYLLFHQNSWQLFPLSSDFRGNVETQKLNRILHRYYAPPPCLFSKFRTKWRRSGLERRVKRKVKSDLKSKGVDCSIIRIIQQLLSLSPSLRPSAELVAELFANHNVTIL
jgi:hypothetical protein